MNSSRKARGLDGRDCFPQVRKRNSISKKVNSRTALNAVQRCTSLLRNNKSLAETLTETRCELSIYKDFFEDTLECMSKFKLARSKMVQLSTSLKIFIKDFDDTLLLMDFDDSKWPSFKASKSSKNIPNGMNTVFEANNEVEEVVSTDQEMHCDAKNNLKGSDQLFQITSSLSKPLQNSVDDEGSSGTPEIPSMSPQKKIDIFVQKISTSEAEQAKGNDGTKTESHNLSPKKHPDSSCVISSTSTHAIKKTKIPRCRSLDVNLKRQNFFKESEPQNSKPCKRKSPQKIHKKSDFDFSKRKTFVIKSNILTDSESATNQTDVEKTSNVSEDVLISKEDKRKTYVKKNINISNESKEATNIPEDLFFSDKDKRKTYVKKPINISNESEETTSNSFVLENDRRKTCVLKNSNILKEIEPYVCLNKLEVEEVVLENRVSLSEVSDIDDVFFPKNNRKTFVKKSSDKIASPHNNIPKHQYSSPVKGYIPVKSNLTSLVAEQNKNSDAENHLQADLVAAKTKSISTEMIEPTAFNDDKKKISTKIIKKDKISTAIHSIADDKMEEVPENLNSKTDGVIPDHTVTDISKHNIDELNRGISRKDEDIMDEACEYSPIKTRRSFLESSESDCEVLFVEEIDFSEKRPAFQITPIRRQISKTKKRNFTFDANKRKSILKKNSSYEDNVDADNINKNGANAVKDKSVHFVSDELVNKDKFDNLQSNACGTKNKTSNKKMKKNQKTSLKNNIEKTAKKPRKIKDCKRNSLKKDELDGLIPRPKKTKKKNVKKKNIDGSYFDDDAISKFREGNKVTSQTDDEVDKTEKDQETDLPCEKTGKNTFLVHAEIHPPPPFSNMPEIKKLDDEIAKLKLKNMEVAVVLDDVLKSKDIKLLNVYDRDILCGKTISMSFSESTSNAFIDLDESIEKLRCDPMPDTDDLCLHSDALLNTSDFDLQSDPGNDAENTRTRRRKNVNYKEPTLNRKMRRC